MSTIANINIRTNLYLWLLTGRSAGFANPALNTTINYVVNSTPKEVVHARRFLKLDTPNNDFHVLAVYAAALMSKPMLREMPQNVDAVFVPGLLALPKVSASVPLLGRSDRSFGYVDGAVAGAKGFAGVIITRVTDTSARIDTDSGLTEISGSTLTSVDGGFRLSVARSEQYGIFADFLVSRWLDDDDISVTLAPTRYPFTDTAAKLRTDRVMMRMMNAEGTLAAFESSPTNPALQVGMAGLAIIRRMFRWIADEQAGYIVSMMKGGDPLEPLDAVYTLNPALLKMAEVPVDPDTPTGFNV